MRRLLLLLFLLTAPVAAQQSQQPIGAQLTSGELSLQVDGSVDFGVRVLTGREQEYAALAGPQVQIVDARGTGQGWTLTVQAGDFQAGSEILSATLFSYHAQGGAVFTIHGQEVSAAGPIETGNLANLANPLQVLQAAPGSGMGTFRWVPSPERFRLVIPGLARAGTYQSTLTFSLTSL